MIFHPSYPTPEHKSTAEAITDFFTTSYPIDAVLLVNSCARGKATRDSCLDISILARPERLGFPLSRLESIYTDFEKTSSAIAALNRAGKYSAVHPNFIDGVFIPQERDETGGPDYFEVGIGNMLVYSFPLWQEGSYFSDLQSQWLPYYGEEMRRERLDMVREYCLNNLHHIPLYIRRGLYFQAFDRLYDAFGEFLQALFISRRTYPIAYNKWIHEQVVDILGLPELYIQLTHLFEIRHFESAEIEAKALGLEQLLETYAPPAPPDGVRKKHLAYS